MQRSSRYECSLHLVVDHQPTDGCGSHGPKLKIGRISGILSLFPRSSRGCPLVCLGPELLEVSTEQIFDVIRPNDGLEPGLGPAWHYLTFVIRTPLRGEDNNGKTRPRWTGGYFIYRISQYLCIRQLGWAVLLQIKGSKYRS